VYSDQPYPLVIAGMYQQAWPKAVEVIGDHLSPKFREFGERYPALVPWFMENLSVPPFTLCHGDFRLDNMFFGAAADHPAITIVDWQICFKGRGAYDLAYFVSQSLPTDVRRQHEDALKERYLSGLAKRGVEYDRKEFDEDYAKTVAYCFIYAVVSAGQIEVTNDRMRDLILSIYDRAAVAIEDSKALEMLPS
jgi:thiamine kinase-like enzyme